jgi:hypothetical protein
MLSFMLRRTEQEKKKQLRQFTVIVNYYHKMWFCRSELLARNHWLASDRGRSSLNSNHLINRSLIWLRESLKLRRSYAIQTSISVVPFIFMLIHKIISWGQSSCRTKSQMSAAFYLWKLNTTQKRYTTNERELLLAIEMCKEYKNTLLGYPIIVFTDHENDTLCSMLRGQSQFYNPF